MLNNIHVLPLGRRLTFFVDLEVNLGLSRLHPGFPIPNYIVYKISNMYLKSHPFAKENNLPNHHYCVSCWFSREYCWWTFVSFPFLAWTLLLSIHWPIIGCPNDREPPFLLVRKVWLVSLSRSSRLDGVELDLVLPETWPWIATSCKARLAW